MALRAAFSKENLGDLCGIVWSGRAVEVGSALDLSKPFGSLIRDTLKSKSVCAATPAGEAVARNGVCEHLRVPRFHAGGTTTMRMRNIAGIDVHKRLLVVAVVSTDEPGEPARFQNRRFGTTTKELPHLLAWLQQQGVEEAVMESTAQYWKPVWLTLEGHLRLHLAQAWSNRPPTAQARLHQSRVGDGSASQPGNLENPERRRRASGAGPALHSSSHPAPSPAR
jgi:hypothetical protein